MPSILIAEDHSIVRLGTIVLIRELYPDAQITEADTFDEAMQWLQQQQFDLLLLDIHIPGGDNLQMVEAVKVRQPDIPILIFSSYDEQLYALRYLQAGAYGYLQKESAAEEIRTAIRQVINREKYVSSRMQKHLLNHLLDPKRNQSDPMENLSNREIEVMQLLIKGHSPTEIKGILNIQYSTISTYKERIFEKMNVTNVIELADKIRQLKPLSANLYSKAKKEGS